MSVERQTDSESQLAYASEVRDYHCVRVLAFAMVLSGTGTEFDEGILDGLLDDVACVRQEFGLSEHLMHEIVVSHEPTLADGILRKRF